MVAEEPDASSPAASVQDHIAFWHALRGTIRQGVSIVEALRLAQTDLPDCALKAAIPAVASDVRSGSDLSEGLSRQGMVFSKSACWMVRAGELTGQLDNLIEVLCEGLEDGSFPLPGAEQPEDPLLGEVLISIGLVTEEQLAEGRAVQMKTGGRLEDALIELGHVDAASVQEARGAQSRQCSTAEIARFFRQFRRLVASGVPIIRGLDILVAEEPTAALREAAQAVRDSIAAGKDLSGALENFKDLFSPKVIGAVRWGEQNGELEKVCGQIADALLAGDVSGLPFERKKKPSGSGKVLSVEDSEDPSPVVTTVNKLIFTAIKEGASAVYIDPFAGGRAAVRMRVRGKSVSGEGLPEGLSTPVASRLKILAGMDIAERRRRQDGKFLMNVGGKPYTIVLNMVPSDVGEKATLRIIPGDRPDVDPSHARFADVDLSEMEISPEVVAKVPAHVAKLYRLVPLAAHGDSLMAVTAEPLALSAEEDLEFLLSMKVRARTLDGPSVDEAIERYYGASAAAVAPLPGSPYDETIELESPKLGPDTMVGAEIASCRLTERLGYGGMGTVYKAHHPVLNKPVAVKVLHDHLLGEEQYVERFISEARAAARLEHPNVVQILNAGREGKLHFIVMQYVDGESLAGRLKREHRLGLGESLRMAEDVAKALSAAHVLGLIHRDIKPENVMLTSSGDVKVADFGLAKDLLAPLGLTASGAAMGTPFYMSPEHGAGGQVDQRTDLYSLGVMMYEMMSGVLPFDGENQYVVLRQHATATPEPLSKHVTGVPSGVERMVAKLLEKKPEDRYQTADALLSDIRKFRAKLQASPASAETRTTPVTISVATDDDELVTREVDDLLHRAIEEGASDVHVSCDQVSGKVSFRIEGKLREEMRVEKDKYPGLIRSLKVRGELDLEERFKPQDGKFNIRIGDRQVDVRVSLIPAVHGEVCVLRILDSASKAIRLSELGFSHDVADKLRRAIQGRGLILVSGPTGSGKSVTLYSLLQEFDPATDAIYTVEEPVELQFPGITQIPVNSKRNLTFAAALRSIMRQDPDVILVGDVRDKECAELVVKAAMTGHLLIAALHTNDAASTITRLADMGIDRYALSGAVALASSQRLVRRLCPACKQEVKLSPGKLEELGLDGEEARKATFYRPIGCDRCRGGYRGRLCLIEVMPMTAKLSELVAGGASSDKIKEQAIQEGMVTMLRYGISECVAGRTSLEEVLAVAPPDS